MKKKILLFLCIVSMLVCLLAISISASTIYKDANGNEMFRYDVFANSDEVSAYFGFANDNSIGTIKSYQGSFPKTDAEGNELTWYVTGTETVGSDTVITVASGTTVGVVGTVNDSGVYNFNSGFKNENIVSANFPDNAGILKLGFGSFGSYSSVFPKANFNLLFIYCPNTLVEFGFNFVQSMPVIVCEVDDETPVTEIPQNFAHDARNLRAINIPASVVTMNGDSGKNGAPFYNNHLLASVTFASDTTLKVMKKSCFTGCHSLTEIKLPNSVTEIGERCFENCKNLEKIYLGASLEKTTGYSVFRLSNKLKVYYLPGTITSVYQHTFTHDSGSGPANTVFFFTGTADEFTTFYNACVAGKNNERVTSGYKAEYVIEWDPTKSDSYYTDLATLEGHKLYIVNYSKCEAFYDGDHVEIENDCVFQCDRCDAFDGQTKENAKHNYVTTITYANYLANGVKTMACQNDGCAHKTTPVTESVNPIIPCFMGYSIKEDGNGITFGYTIDYAALDEHAKISGKKIDLGFVVAAQSKVTDNKLLNADGSVVNANVIKASVVTWSNVDSENADVIKYCGADFKLTGDFTGLENVAICMAGYLFDGAVAYLNANASGEASDYITYGELVTVTE